MSADLSTLDGMQQNTSHTIGHEVNPDDIQYIHTTIDPMPIVDQGDRLAGTHGLGTLGETCSSSTMGYNVSSVERSDSYECPLAELRSPPNTHVKPTVLIGG